MRYYLGIDIGGTKTKAVLLSGLRRQTPRCFSVDTPRNKKRFLRMLEKLVVSVAAGKKVNGIGVGVPGVMDRARGVLMRAPNLPFLNGWNVRKFFQRFSTHVAVDNDSRCMVRAEAAWGAARRYKNVVGLSVGTGIGGGIMIDGKMYYGKNNGAGEFGHRIIAVGSKGQAVSLEQLAGKKAFEKYGDRSEIIGIGVANLIRSLDPDIVVLGGGGVHSGAIKLDTVRRVERRYNTVAKKTPIVKGVLGDAAGAIGAALVFKTGY